ncbi:MAG TPA: hypothetical protein VIL69_13380 [Roseomonas sp.]
MSMRLPLLLTACAGLGYLSVGQEALAPPQPLLRPVSDVSNAAPIASLPEPPTGPWSEQSARPLFNADRRPPVITPPVVPRIDPEPQPPLAATGVALRSGGALALLRLADDRIVRVRVGDDVDGWQVARISGDGVHLTRGRQAVTLTARVAPAEGLARVE